MKKRMLKRRRAVVGGGRGGDSLSDGLARAAAYYRAGDLLKAKSEYRHLAALYPENGSIFHGLGVVLCERGECAAAVAAFERAAARDPDNSRTFHHLGVASAEMGNSARAEESFSRAAALDPAFAKNYYLWGVALIHAGRFADAEQRLRQAIRLDPQMAGVYNWLSRCKQYESANDADFAAIHELLPSPGLSVPESISLHFSLGKMYDDCACFGQAFDHYKKGNTLRRKTITANDFNQHAMQAFFDRLRVVFNKAFIDRVPAGPSRSELPVFIVGMPRSGTSLLEQIIASHPAVHGAGELDTLAGLVKRLIRRAGLFPECLRNLGDAAFAAMGREYLAAVKGMAGHGFSRVTDKMPLNFYYLGLITQILPGAKIIHCRRNPYDTCLSNYFQLYDTVIPFTYDLDDLGFYYSRYLRLMEHWRSVLPAGRLLEVDYEDLVRDREGGARRLIDFINLPWDERCLSYNKEERAVKTASAWQVRQPVYTKSVARWQNYRQYLDPLVNHLGPPEAW